MIFGKPLVSHCIKYDSFSHSVSNERKMAFFGLCVSFVLTQNEHVWNFHSSLTLTEGILILYSGSLYYAIVLNMTHFFILFGMRKHGLF